ncbi:MAG: hypothetical protein R3E39_04550 [Anaerolineae bacterium]
MDAKTLFQEGVVAIRDEKDLAKGRELLMQSLKIEPKNEMGWLWLSRTMHEPAKRIQCLERALKINPKNEQTKALIHRLSGSSPTNNVTPSSTDNNSTYKRTASTIQPPTLTSTQITKAGDTDESYKPENITPLDYSAKTETSVSKPIDNATLTPKLPLDALDVINGKVETSMTMTTEQRKPKAASTAESSQIKDHMSRAQIFLDKNAIEDAIEQWVRVLEIEVDHEEAIGNAVRHLSRLKYIDDARELVWNALDAGTKHPSIYLTAIDIAKYQGHDGEADELRLKLGQLPDAGEKTVFNVADYFMTNQPQKALAVLDGAILNYPKNQKIALRRAQLAEELGLQKEAAAYYEEVARLGTRTKEGQAADAKLDKIMPRITDKERGSVMLAMREAFGVGFLFFLMGWQDAGLNLLNLGLPRLGGILLSIIGGYLLVTGTSAPQQKPLAAWLGGSVPASPKSLKNDEPDTDSSATIFAPEDTTELPLIPGSVRITLVLVGIALLIGAFAVVFSMSISLFRNPDPQSFFVPTLEDLIRNQ